jgi:hypothetical protein
MKGLKNRIILEVQNYQSVLNTKEDCEHLADRLMYIIIREMKIYLYLLDLPADVEFKIISGIDDLQNKVKFTELDIRKAIQLARHTVSNEDQIITELNGKDF